MTPPQPAPRAPGRPDRRCSTTSPSTTAARLSEDVGNQAYLGGVWVYDIASGRLTEVAQHDPDGFTPGVEGFLTKDEETSGVIPAPFLGPGQHQLDVQAHYATDTELVQGGQLLAVHIPPTIGHG
jgi:hypothetical protein